MTATKHSKKVQEVLELREDMQLKATKYRNMQAISRQPLPKGGTPHPRSGKIMGNKKEYFQTGAATAYYRALEAEEAYKKAFEKLKPLEKQQVLETK